MREPQKGVWHWTATHPDWKPGQEWGREVLSYAIDDGERLLLLDPLAPPSEIDELAAERETAIVLTCPWHRRDAQSLAERLGSLRPGLALRPRSRTQCPRMHPFNDSGRSCPG